MTNDYPHDIELGLAPLDDWRDQVVVHPCGCALYADLDHDVDDCLEAQADALAEAEDERRERDECAKEGA